MFDKKLTSILNKENIIIFLVALLFSLLILLTTLEISFTLLTFFSIIFITPVMLKVIDFLHKKKEDKNRTELENVLQALNEYSTDRLIRDEREFETSIYEYLKIKLSNYTVKFQQKINGNRRVDIVINNKIAIELKIADNRGNLDSLFAQVEWYKDTFKDLILVILDLGKVHSINEYRERFEDKGAKVVIKKLRVKR